MADQIAFINVRPVWRRLLLLPLAALVVVAAWHGAGWCIGSTIADYAQDFETAEAASRLAPGDPLPHLRLARLRRMSFLPEDIPESLRHYDRAAALAPNDYLIWLEVGRARASAGDTEAGLRALRRAVELAPHYAQPRWHLGNTLLRAGQIEEAFAELRLAADADPSLRPQVFNLAWHVYSQNPARVIEAVSRTPAARAQLLRVLLARGRVEDAQAVWSGLSGQERGEHQAVGEELARTLYAGKQYHRALRVLEEAGWRAALPNVIANGGFESDISGAGKQLFQWQVGSASGTQVVIDSRVARAGSRSLRILFNSPGQTEFDHVSQLVAVQPSTRYQLRYFVRTDDLRSASTLVTQVLDWGGEPALLGSSAPVPNGTGDWQQVTIDFTTRASTEGVLVRLVRPDCPDAVCPIFGKIWYDDFNLERAGGRPASR